MEIKVAKNKPQKTKHTLQLVTFLQLFRPFFTKMHCKPIKTGTGQSDKNCHFIITQCYGFKYMHLFQQWYHSSIVQSFLYELFSFMGGKNNNWREQGGYRFPVQLLMPYNYTLRHAVKCYTNNNINREQLQSQCKLYRRKVLIL